MAGGTKSVAASLDAVRASLNAGRSALVWKRQIADTDTPILDSQAIILGVKWRFMQAKGVSVAASFQTEYIDYVQQLIARDGGAPTLTMGRRNDPYLLGPFNVQDANYPAGSGSS